MIGRIGRGLRRADEVVEGVIANNSHAEALRSFAQKVLSDLYH